MICPSKNSSIATKLVMDVMVDIYILLSSKTKTLCLHNKYRYAQSNGLTILANYTYTGSKGVCKTVTSGKSYIAGYNYVHDNNGNTLDESVAVSFLPTNGPLAFGKKISEGLRAKPSGFKSTFLARMPAFLFLTF